MSLTSTFSLLLLQWIWKWQIIYQWSI